MAKQEKPTEGKQQSLPEPPKSPPAALTYYGRRKGHVWEVWRVDVAEDGKLTQERVLEHPQRAVARYRLELLLSGVLP